MPNWCSNSGTIVTRDPSLLIEKRPVREDSEQTYQTISFQGLVPRPKELDIDKGYFGETPRQEAMEKAQKENIAKYGHADWYEWNLANWGTKWDACDGNCDVDDNGDGTFTVTFQFETAWSPPLEWYDKIIQHESIISIEASFYEPGCEILGTYHGKEGSGSPDWEEIPNQYYSDALGCDVLSETPGDAYLLMEGEDGYVMLQDYIDQMHELILKAESEEEIRSLETEREKILDYFGESLADPDDDPEKELEKDLLP